MTSSEMKGIIDIAIFDVTLCLRAWITAPWTIKAPLKDFTLMKALVKFPHKASSDITSKKLGLHLWYLSEELLALA